MITPKHDGFYMPAEWEKHKATWMAWPYDQITFSNRIEKVEDVFVSIIQHLHRCERVELLVVDLEMQKRVEQKLQAKQINRAMVNIHIVDYADVWIRDYGPTFLTNHQDKRMAWSKWRYNAYGDKFPELLKDDSVTEQLKDYLAMPYYDSGIFMEGGAIESNGYGTILTTEECLLNPNRNKNLDKKQIEEILKEFLGANKVIWLKSGLTNDHTDGHIDEIARFVDKNTIVYAYEENENEPDYEILRENLSILHRSADQDGNAFKLIRLPLPKIYFDDGIRAPASYANFYIANQLVLIPEFGHVNDVKAKQILKDLFPDRKVIGIDCTDLIYGGGTIHCITQQQSLPI